MIIGGRAATINHAECRDGKRVSNHCKKHKKDTLMSAIQKVAL